MYILGDEAIKKKVKEKQELIERISEPKKKHLSRESQKIVVEGSLYIVFNSTREWYNFFEGKITMEILYYICLEALFNAVKYMTHCEKPVFELYILKSIEQNMIKYISKKMHISYREAYCIINNVNYEEDFSWKRKKKEISFDYEIEENIEKPSKIFYLLKNEYFDIDYIKSISSEEFLNNYYLALNNLSYEEEIIMRLSYTIDGERGLTIKEIADYLGIDHKKVYSIKKRAINVLKKDKKLKSYLV